MKSDAAGELPERHLSPESFAEYLRQGIPIEHRVFGTPNLTLFINPSQHLIGLRGPAGASELQFETGLEHVSTSLVYVSEERQLAIAITSPDLFIEGYVVLCAIADKVQLSGLTMTTAIADTLRMLGQLLEATTSLTIDAELGLLGELVLFRGLLAGFEPQQVVAFWRGPSSEEHDFGVDGIDIEVKATTAERRTHWISSLTQLQPTPPRPLWVVSQQLTRAAPDAGHSLLDLVTTIRRSIGDGPARTQFEQCLRQAGWREAYAAVSRNRWLHRMQTLCFAVTNDFPRLTADLLESSGVSLLRVQEVRYRIDLTDRSPKEIVPRFLESAVVQGALK